MRQAFRRARRGPDAPKRAGSDGEAERRQSEVRSFSRRDRSGRRPLMLANRRASSCYLQQAFSYLRGGFGY
jgi:hypothetical protein